MLKERRELMRPILAQEHQTQSKKQRKVLEKLMRLKREERMRE